MARVRESEDVPRDAQVELAAEEGFPVTVELDGYPDGPLTLTYAGERGPNTYNVENGRVTVHTRARLDELAAIGARPVS